MSDADELVLDPDADEEAASTDGEDGDAGPRLTGKQRRHLRALGHHLQPIVHIGKEGLSEAFVDAVDQALEDHELIKVRLLETANLDRHEAAEELAAATGAAVAQVLGGTILLYRARDEDPEIELP